MKGNTMKVFAIGAPRNKGVSTKKVASGKPYDITSLSILTPIEPGSGSGANGTWERSGYGYQVTDLPIAEGKIELFKDVQFPCELDVLTDTVQRFGRMQTEIVGVNAVKLKAAA
jgi:hypothetical protein